MTRHDGTLRTAIETPLETPVARREVGTGSLYYSPSAGIWYAAVYIAGRKRVRRKRHSREDAVLALQSLFDEFEGQLGYSYTAIKPYRLTARRTRPPRSGVTKRVRFEVFARDDFTCRYCGAAAPEVRLVVDHVISVADGGSDDPSNLVAACVDCNVGKGAKSLTPKGDTHE